MVLPPVSVGGVNVTSAVCGQGIALTFVAVVVVPELDELEPELLLLELLELLLDPEPLELELEVFEPLELLELAPLELLLELPPLELLELDPSVVQS